MKNIDSYKNSQGKIWLNVASSVYVLDDFVNLDNNIFLHFLALFKRFKKIVPKKYWEIIEQYSEAKEKALLIRKDCRKPLFFPDNSVDHILCSHFLEHVFLVEMEKIIVDFYRVMKNNATLHIIVPDLRAQAELYLKNNNNGELLSADNFVRDTLLSRDSKGSFKYRLLEYLGAFGLQHRWMYDYNSMKKKLEDVGFGIIEENTTPSRLFRLNDNSVHIIAVKP